MFEGRVVNYDRLELKLDITGVSVTDLSVGRAEYSVGGQLICWQALTPTGTESETHTVGTETASWVKNIWMQAETTHSGSVWSFQWLERGITTSGTGAGAVRLEIDDYRLYARKEGTWRLRIGESRLYVGASLIATYASITINSSETISPRTRPVFSIPPEGVAVATAVNAINVTEAAAAGFSYTSEVTVSGTVVAGWRFIDGVDTVTLPIAWSAPNLPALSGVTASLPSMVGTTTWDAGLSVYAYEKREDNWCSDGPGSVLPRPYITAISRAGRWWVWPVLDRSVHRMADPSESLIVRGGFPEVESRGTANTYLSGSFFEDLPGTTASAVSSPTYTPEHTEFLEMVGNTLGVIEEPFTQSIYSPVRLAGSYAEAGTVELSQAWGGTLPAVCSSPDWRTGRIAKSSSVQWIDAYAVQTRGDAVLLTANPDIIASYTHDEPMARLFLTWFCPHWHFAPWFPPNTIDSDSDTIPDEQDVWKVFTVSVPVEYWLTSRQQYVAHPSLGDMPEYGIPLGSILGLGLGG